jgi:predicted transcriptional regulator
MTHLEELEAKVRETFDAVLARKATAAELETIAHEFHAVAWIVGDSKAVARAESKIWDAVAFGSRDGR